MLKWENVWNGIGARDRNHNSLLIKEMRQRLAILWQEIYKRIRNRTRSRYYTSLLLANRSLPPIFDLGVFDGLPLHVFGKIFPTCAKRHNVVDYIAFTDRASLSGTRAWVMPLEVTDDLFTAGYAAFIVTLDVAGLAVGSDRFGQCWNGYK